MRHAETGLKGYNTITILLQFGAICMKNCKILRLAHDLQRVRIGDICGEACAALSLIVLDIVSDVSFDLARLPITFHYSFFTIHHSLL